MNRLKENKNLGYRSAWVLACAYAAAGKVQTASAIIDGLGSKNFEEYSPYNRTYGSSTRDKAIAIEALALTDHVAEALPLAQEVAERFNNAAFSTQETAFAAIALDRLSSKASSSLKAEVGGKSVSSAKGFHSMKAEGSFSVKNTSEGPVYATLVSRWMPEATDVTPARSSGLEIAVAYKDANGKVISPDKLVQGSEFTASIKVKNLNRASGYNLMALQQVVPSGWEILNERLRGTLESDGYDLIDIRDDRVQWIFSLGAAAEKTFSIKLRAAYEGSYVLPEVSCQAMYEPSVAANTASGTTQVVR